MFTACLVYPSKAFVYLLTLECVGELGVLSSALHIGGLRYMLRIKSLQEVLSVISGAVNLHAVFKLFTEGKVLRFEKLQNFF